MLTLAIEQYEDARYSSITRNRSNLVPRYEAVLVSIRQHTSVPRYEAVLVSIRQHTSAYVSIRQLMKPFYLVPRYEAVLVSVKQSERGVVLICRYANILVYQNSILIYQYTKYQHTLWWSSRAYAALYSSAVSIRQHTSAYVSIRQHTSAYVSINKYMYACVCVCVCVQDSRSLSTKI